MGLGPLVIKADTELSVRVRMGHSLRHPGMERLDDVGNRAQGGGAVALRAVRRRRRTDLPRGGGRTRV